MHLHHQANTKYNTKYTQSIFLDYRQITSILFLNYTWAPAAPNQVRTYTRITSSSGYRSSYTGRTGSPPRPRSAFAPQPGQSFSTCTSHRSIRRPHGHSRSFRRTPAVCVPWTAGRRPTGQAHRHKYDVCTVRSLTFPHIGTHFLRFLCNAEPTASAIWKGPPDHVYGGLAVSVGALLPER